MMKRLIFLLCLVLPLQAQVLVNPYILAAGGGGGGGTGIPVIAAVDSANATGAASLDVPFPAGIQAGDLLIILMANEANNSTAQWDDATLKPTGFTLINESGNTTTDCHVGAFYKVAAGTESGTINVPHATSGMDVVGWCIRLTSVDGAAPLNQTGSDVNTTGTATSIDITGATTSADSCRAFYICTFDGGDDGGYSPSGTGWVEWSEYRTGTGAGNAGGSWGTKEIPATSTASGTVTVSHSSPGGGDGMTGFQFIIKGAD